MEITPLLVLLCAGVYFPVSLSRLRQFILVKNETIWNESRDNCRKIYTDLVTIYNQEDFHLLANLVNESKPSVWIGLTRTKPNLQWSNGDLGNFTLVSKPNASEYTSPICLAIHRGNTTWDHCNETKTFMCFKKGTSNVTLVQENKTWYDAQSYCRKNYTDLVSIRNEEQMEEVKNAGITKTTPYWIGLLYDDWGWVDGGRSAYRNWNTDLPKDEDISNCGKIWMNQIMNVPCDNNEHYFCNTVHINITRERMTWEQGLVYCNTHHNGLLRIESAEDQTVTEQMLTLNGINITGPIWLGLRQSNLFGFWVWTNGLPLKTENWSNWKGGRQPELHLSQHCGAMETEGDFKWTDEDCLSSLYVIYPLSSAETDDGDCNTASVSLMVSSSVSSLSIRRASSSVMSSASCSTIAISRASSSSSSNG
ncbi:hypothetical protein UPYG_G00343720 [Umbra pygmaea]|uniref:C-type lectin domain-containing protein n=1 Tax=Umbra pygmaea TaxID=75934 RepID=A0ABD0WJA1_UMBPY